MVLVQMNKAPFPSSFEMGNKDCTLPTSICCCYALRTAQTLFNGL